MIAANLTLPGVSRAPVRPPTGHAQRVLRGWLYELLAAAPYELTIPQMCKECPGFTEAEIRETAALLVAADLLRPVRSLESWKPLDLWTTTIDQACLNTVCGAVDGKPVPLSTILEEWPLASRVSEAVVGDVLLELESAGRVERTPFGDFTGAIWWELSESEYKTHWATYLADEKAKKARAR